MFAGGCSLHPAGSDIPRATSTHLPRPCDLRTMVGWALAAPSELAKGLAPREICRGWRWIGGGLLEERGREILGARRGPAYYCVLPHRPQAGGAHRGARCPPCLPGWRVVVLTLRAPMRRWERSSVMEASATTKPSCSRAVVGRVRGSGWVRASWIQVGAGARCQLEGAVLGGPPELAHKRHTQKNHADT